jgi:hypothetical protein
MPGRARLARVRVKWLVQTPSAAPAKSVLELKADLICFRLTCSLAQFSLSYRKMTTVASYTLVSRPEIFIYL